MRQLSRTITIVRSPLISRIFSRKPTKDSKLSPLREEVDQSALDRAEPLVFTEIFSIVFVLMTLQAPYVLHQFRFILCVDSSRNPMITSSSRFSVLVQCFLEPGRVVPLVTVNHVLATVDELFQLQGAKNLHLRVFDIVRRHYIVSDLAGAKLPATGVSDELPVVSVLAIDAQDVDNLRHAVPLSPRHTNLGHYLTCSL